MMSFHSTVLMDNGEAREPPTVCFYFILVLRCSIKTEHFLLLRHGLLWGLNINVGILKVTQTHSYKPLWLK